MGLLCGKNGLFNFAEQKNGSGCIQLATGGYRKTNK